jgi:hypothetical protein
MLPEAMRFALISAAVAARLSPLLISRRHRVVRSPGNDDDPTDALRAPHRDLADAGVLRLLVQVAGVVTQAYLLYYFESIPTDDRVPTLPERIGYLLTLAFLLPLPTALTLGRLSDLTRRRKPFLLITAGGGVGQADGHGGRDRLGRRCRRVRRLHDRVFGVRRASRRVRCSARSIAAVT